MQCLAKVINLGLKDAEESNVEGSKDREGDEWAGGAAKLRRKTKDATPITSILCCGDSMNSPVMMA